MEINDYKDILGVVTTEEITEGRMVLLVDHSETYDYGSREDLPGVKLPDTSGEAAKARYCITFPVSQAEPPIYEPYPTVTNSLRYGFDQVANAPFSAKVHLTYPGYKNGEVIPSGSLALAFGAGVYTVPSGAWIYNANIVTGAYLTVADTASDSASDAGKLKYSASASAIECLEVDDDNNLTFKILY